MEILEFHLKDFKVDEDFEKTGGQAKVYKGFHLNYGYYILTYQFILISEKLLLKNGFLLRII